MTDTAYYLKILSTFSVLLPILIGIWGKFHRKWPYQIFLALLVFGFFIDLGGWYMYVSQNTSLNWVLRYAYNLVEPLCFFWLIGYFTSSKITRKMTIIFAGLAFAYWIFVLFQQSAFSGLYLFNGISLTFFSGFLVLEIIENKKEASLPLSFWIAFGIFFYHLSTFFVKGLLNTQIAAELWFIQNLVNIVTNIIFALGFWFNRKTSQSPHLGLSS